MLCYVMVIHPINLSFTELWKEDEQTNSVAIIKAMPHGSDFYNEFARIHQIYEKSYRAMEFLTKSL